MNPRSVRPIPQPRLHPTLENRVRGCPPVSPLLRDSVLGNRKRFLVPILPGPFDVSRDHSVSSNCSRSATKWPDGRLIDFPRSTDMRKGEQTRQEIIRKASPIFNQKGYSVAVFNLPRKRLERSSGICSPDCFRSYQISFNPS
jgi:hypothetical protein